MQSETADSSITLVYGFWGQNIGNAFFNLGGTHQLTHAGRTCNFIQDAPGYWTLHRKSKGNFRQWFDTISRVSTPWLILQGPLLHDASYRMWSDTLPQLRSRGVKLGLLGVSLNSYDGSDRAAAVEFVSRYRPEFVITRDEQTAETLAGCDVPLHSGVDSAFFVGDAYRPVPLDARFCVTNFDFLPEPRLIEARVSDQAISPDGQPLAVNFPRVLRQVRRYGQVLSYASSLLPRATVPSELPDGTTIIRTDHRANPHLPFRTYRWPNSVCSDEPYTYLSLYSGARFVLTDRVHSCVASASYGTPFKFFGSTPRAALLEHIPKAVGSDGLTRVDQSALASMKQAQLEFLTSALK